MDIDDLIRHSRVMLKHAEAGEWETVADEEGRRRRLFNEFFSTSSNVASVPNIDVAIRELLRVNEMLEILSVAARDEAKSAINSIKTGRIAINAYRENTR